MIVLKVFSILFNIFIVSSKRLGYKEGRFISKLEKNNEEENVIIVSKDNNTIEFDDEVYNLNDLVEEKDLFSPNLINIEDGKEVENEDLYTYWGGFMNGKHVFVTKDKNGDVEFLSIMNDFDAKCFIAVKNSSSRTTEKTSFLSKIDLKSDEEAVGDFSDDYIVTEDTKSYPMNITHRGDYFLSSNITSFYEETEDESSIFSYYSRCTYYRQIDVAIAYDTTFCKYCGGPNKARKKIIEIINLASNRFRQKGLCIKVRLSALEGHCNVNTDPYLQMRYQNSGCEGNGLLQDFTFFWHYNRKHIPRDASHLFVGRDFHDRKIGCAGIGTLCRGAYGVEAISNMHTVDMQSLLFTHELGHNCGAYHSNDRSTIMYPYIADGSNGFSGGTTSSMLNYLNHQNCLKIVT